MSSAPSTGPARARADEDRARSLAAKPRPPTSRIAPPPPPRGSASIRGHDGRACPRRLAPGGRADAARGPHLGARRVDYDTTHGRPTAGASALTEPLDLRAAGGRGARGSTPCAILSAGRPDPADAEALAPTDHRPDEEPNIIRTPSTRAPRAGRGARWQPELEAAGMPAPGAAPGRDEPHASVHVEFREPRDTVPGRPPPRPPPCRPGAVGR